MIKYYFFLDWRKTIKVWRSTAFELGYCEDEAGATLFPNKGEAELDFYGMLYDNEELRKGEFIDLDKTNKKKSTKAKVVKDIVMQEKKPRVIYDTLQINTLYNEDCLSTMSRMPDGYVDYIITSPPYNVGKNIEYDEDMYGEYKDNLSHKEYHEWLYKIINECYRVTKNHVFFNIQMLSANKKTVLKIHGDFCDIIKDKIQWFKDIAVPHIQPGIMNGGYEDIFIFSKDNPESKKFSNVRFSQGQFRNTIKGNNASQNNYSKHNHATMPLYVPRIITNAFIAPGSLVYDPFTGTGTTQTSCVIELCDFIGSEMDEKQFNIANQRIKDEQSKLKIKF